MGSKTYSGVRFQAYPDDHVPPHVHRFYAGVEVIVDLVDGFAELSHRPKPVRPRNAKQSDVNHILRTATQYADELLEIWRIARG